VARLLPLFGPMASALFVGSEMTQPNRDPIGSYERAVWRLVSFQIADGAADQELDYAVQIVADVFWLSDAKVRHDMRRAAAEIDHSFSPARDKRYSRGGF